MNIPNLSKQFAMFFQRKRNIAPISYNKPSNNKPSVTNNKYSCLMKTNYFLFLLVVLFVSCSSDSDTIHVENIHGENKYVDVNVSFAGMNISMNSDEDEWSGTRATTSEAGVTHIALKVFDSTEKEIYSAAKIKQNDGEDFDKISFSLLPGTYSFVAVAHKSSNPSEPVANIVSKTKATLNRSLAATTFCTVKEVTIGTSSTTPSGGDTNAMNVTLDMGKRINATFRLLITDQTPSDVESLEIILYPNLSETTKFEIDPSTGFALNQYRSKVEYLKSATQSNTFTDQGCVIHSYVRSADDKVDVTINAKSTDGTVLYTQTLSNVSIKPYHYTTATGRFFSVTTNASFEFNVEMGEITIPLR